MVPTSTDKDGRRCIPPGRVLEVFLGRGVCAGSSRMSEQPRKGLSRQREPQKLRLHTRAHSVSRNCKELVGAEA